MVEKNKIEIPTGICKGLSEEQFQAMMNVSLGMKPLWENALGKDWEKIMTPEQLGKRMVAQEDIYGGNTVEEAAKLFTKIIKGEGSFAQNAVVLANAAMALHCTGNFKTYENAYTAAVDSLDGGKAYQTLQKLISLQ